MFVILCYCIIVIIIITFTILIVIIYIAQGTDLLLDVTLFLKEEAQKIRLLLLHYQWNIIYTTILK